MNIKLLGLIAAVIAVAGGALFWVGQDESTGEDSANTDTVQQEDADNPLSSDNFLNINTAALNGAYRLLVTSNDGGVSLNGTFELDGNGNVSTVVTQDGQQSGFIILDDVTYIQNPEDGSWIFYPAGAQAAPSIDVNDLALSDDDINEINNDSSVEDLGEQPCAAGTCRVYRDIDEEQNETALVKIDVSNNRLSEVELTNNTTGEVTMITYEYPGEIIITAPEGATEFVIPDFTQ